MSGDIIGVIAMNDYICRVAVIKTKLRKVLNFYNVWVSANNKQEAKQKLIERFKNSEGTGLIFIKDMIKKV